MCSPIHVKSRLAGPALLSILGFFSSVLAALISVVLGMQTTGVSVKAVLVVRGETLHTSAAKKAPIPRKGFRV
jgi:hypothetical protein